MRRRVLLLIVLGSGVLAALAPARVPTNAHSARAAAERILSKLQLPPGASRSAGDPSGSKLAKPGLYPLTPDLIDLHQFWTVPGSPGDVFSWIEAHPPAGSALRTRGGNLGAAFFDWAGFSFIDPGRGGAPSEVLTITVTAARHGGTALRADGQVVWQRLRPRSERIPAGVRSVSVSERGLNGHRSGQWTVTDRGRVGRAVSIIDGLPAGQPGPVACPADFGPYVTLGFDSAAGERLATAVADGSGCLGVNLSIRGRSEPGLQGNPKLIGRLSSALGISL